MGMADFPELNAEVPRPVSHIGADHIPTEEERRVLILDVTRCCALAATSMLITQGLISKGILSSHPKYGSIPKLILACIMTYSGGKLSFMETCQEKFKNLKFPPLGEDL
uniref:OCIA domain-containing protein 1 n=1 Tax=Marmota marmota marmota TaxID=9994 RepID=A0A8C5ZBB6_MARMA